MIVCDGFVGNVALKVSEGLVGDDPPHARESLEATVTRKIGYALSRSAYTDFKKRVDYSEYGGAPLLGVKGVCIICHGRSDSNAIKNAIRVAADFASSNMNQRIEEELREFCQGLAGVNSMRRLLLVVSLRRERFCSKREIQPRPMEADVSTRPPLPPARPSSAVWKPPSNPSGTCTR